MSIPVGQVIDMLKLEIQNLRFQQLAADISGPVEGLTYWNTTDHRERHYTGSAWEVVPHIGSGTPAALAMGGAAAAGSSLYAARLDHAHAMPAQASAATPSVVVVRDGNGRAQFADPAAAADAATKGYVDGLINGTDWKASVRAATAAAGTLASSFANGSVIDGITLATGDRILLKDQAAPAENGIYTVNASGAPTRALDMDAWAEIPGAAVSVELGTANADKTFVCTSDQGGTLGTTAITWVNISSGSIAANSVDNTKLAQMATMTLKGNNTGGTANAADLTVAQVKTMLGSVSKYTALVGNGSLTTITVAHNLGVTGSTCMVYEATGSLREVLCEKQCTDTNTWTLVFAVAPASNALRVVVIG
jgi:hypothetical protein